MPATIAGNVAKSSNGQTTGPAKLSGGTKNVQGVTQAQYTTNGSQQSAPLGVGRQATAEKTTVKTIFGIKFSW